MATIMNTAMLQHLTGLSWRRAIMIPAGVWLGLWLALWLSGLTGCAPRPPAPPPEIRPVPLASLIVIVEGVRGDRVPGACVTLARAADTRLTDAEGVARWGGGIPPGPVHLWVEAAGHAIADQVVEIVLPETMVTIRLEALPEAPLPPIPPMPVTIRGRLQRRGRLITYGDGAPFPWRGVTAFQLLDHVADGRIDDARAFLNWAHDEGFTLVRVLMMARALFDLSPDLAYRHIPRFFELAEAADVYVEVVAVSDSLVYGMDERSITEHVMRIAGACGQSVVCAGLEVANENSHPTQVSGLLTNSVYLTTLRARIDGALLVSLGSTHGADDESDRFAAGDYLTVHLDRSGDLWNMVGRVNKLRALSEHTNRPVVSDEPIGAGEVDDPGRRVADPAPFWAFGVLSRLMSVPTTFHCEDCLDARVPGPQQQAAARAFIAGTRIASDSTQFTFFNSGWGPPLYPDAPVRSFDEACAVRVYSGVFTHTEQDGLTLVLGQTCDPQIGYRAGWQAVEALETSPGVALWRIQR